jgi:hypothetical protein
MEKALRRGILQDLRKQVNGKDEEQGREGVSLPQAPTMVGLTHHPVEKHTRSCRHQESHQEVEQFTKYK